MIQINGLSVSYVDDAGNQVTVDASTWDKYAAVMLNSDKQSQAARDNTQAQGKYMTELSDFQTNLDAGRAAGMTAPSKPLRIVVSDVGTVSHTPFLPALPDPVYPVITPSSGSIKSAAPPVQPTTVEQAIISGMLSMSATINAMVAALKAKGIM